MRLVRPLCLLATAVWTASAPAEAEDECQTDEECVELYTEGFTCASGSLGRYCLEGGCTDWGCPGSEWEEPYAECTTDTDCEEARGADWICWLDGAETGVCVQHECDVDADCASHGPAWRCVDWGAGGTQCERDWEYVPPFRSCTVATPDAAPSDRGAALAVLGAALAIAASRRGWRV